jgi:hypothetical protein
VRSPMHASCSEAVLFDWIHLVSGADSKYSGPTILSIGSTKHQERVRDVSCATRSSCYHLPFEEASRTWSEILRSGISSCQPRHSSNTSPQFTFPSWLRIITYSSLSIEICKAPHRILPSSSRRRLEPLLQCLLHLPSMILSTNFRLRNK